VEPARPGRRAATGLSDDDAATKRREEHCANGSATMLLSRFATPSTAIEET
jgi:hypothetical protein